MSAGTLGGKFSLAPSISSTSEEDLSSRHDHQRIMADEKGKEKSERGDKVKDLPAEIKEQ